MEIKVISSVVLSHSLPLFNIHWTTAWNSIATFSAFCSTSAHRTTTTTNCFTALYSSSSRRPLVRARFNLQLRGRWRPRAASRAASEIPNVKMRETNARTKKQLGSSKNQAQPQHLFRPDKTRSWMWVSNYEDILKANTIYLGKTAVVSANRSVAVLWSAKTHVRFSFLENRQF